MENPTRDVWEAEFRERFRCLFELKPGITSNEVYDILKATDFDEKEAIGKIWELANRPKLYRVPAEIMNRPLGPLPATKCHLSGETPKASTKAAEFYSPLSSVSLPANTPTHLSRKSVFSECSKAPEKMLQIGSLVSSNPSSPSNTLPSPRKPTSFEILHKASQKPAVDSPTSPIASTADDPITAGPLLTSTALSGEYVNKSDIFGTRRTVNEPSELQRNMERTVINVKRWQSQIDEAESADLFVPEPSRHESDDFSEGLDEFPDIFEYQATHEVPAVLQAPPQRKFKLTNIRKHERSKSESDLSTDSSDALPDIPDIRAGKAAQRGAPGQALFNHETYIEHRSGIDKSKSNREPISKGSKAAKKPALEGNTTVTKWIGKLAGGLFVRNLLVCGTNKDENESGFEEAARAENTTVQALIDMTVDPEEIRRAGWTGRKVTEEITLMGKLWDDTDGSGKVGYASARVDGVHLEPGDFVTVRPGEDEHPVANKNGKKTAPPDPSLSTSIWFARLVYVFQAEYDTLMAHVQWMAHGGETILRETAGPRELFLLSRCDDIPLGSIAGKIKVDYRGRKGGCSGVGTIEESYHEVNHYFYRQHYSEATEVFEEAHLHEDLSALHAVPGTLYCDSCEIRKREEKKTSATLIEKKRADETSSAISHQGVSYHLRDFVYITPEAGKPADEPYIIGQITSIRPEGLHQYFKSDIGNLSIQISVQTYERCDMLLDDYLDEIKKKHIQTRDHRRLYRTKKFITVCHDRLDGKCVVRHLDAIDDLNAFKDLEDTFYVTHEVKHRIDVPQSLRDLVTLQSKDFRHVSKVDDELNDYMSQQSAFLKIGQQLRTMDVFAGAGLLSAGLDSSGACTTKWAVESNPSAASTFKRNHAGACVYCHDANIVLRKAVEENLGINSSPLLDEHGNVLPKLPKPGEVDMVIGGCPCQDFTRCNQYQKANSPKNSLLATLLSYVEHFRPKYFLLENVKDLVDHRLGSSQINIYRTEGGLEMGAAKFILRALTSMGYQCQFSVLQAGEHGTPQSRKRVFFWGSLPGYRLPKYPEPSHIFIGNKFRYSRRTRRSAPHRAVTVGDAIMDLPAFDWNMSVREETAASKVARSLRAEVVTQVSLSDNVTERIGKDLQIYSAEPLSEYQRQARSQITGNAVQNHYTCRWGGDMMERILRIPMHPNANHNDIPAKWDMSCLRTTLAAKKHQFYPDRFKRLDFESKFQTCLTKVDPSGKNGSVLHPNQHRVLTVREQARAMGVPDSFTWDHDTQTPKDMYRQLGNGVAIPPARGLGRELLKVRVLQWVAETAARSPDDVLPSTEYHDDDIEMEDITENNVMRPMDSKNDNMVEIVDENGDKWLQID